MRIHLKNTRDGVRDSTWSNKKLLELQKKMVKGN